MPAHALARVLIGLLGSKVMHMDMALFLSHGFRMGIIQMDPLTIWIRHVGKNGITEEQWTYLPHLTRANKTVLRKPFMN